MIKNYNKDLLEKLKDLESELNLILFQGIPLGSVIAKYYSLLFLRDYGIYSNKESSLRVAVKHIALIIKTFFVGIINKHKVKAYGKVILFNKLAERPHLDSMIDPLVLEYSKRSLIYTRSNTRSIIPYNFTKCLKLSSLIEIVIFLSSTFPSIYKKFKAQKVDINSFELMHILIVQLIALTNWNRFFNINKLKLVVVDFDRDYVTSPMVLAAKKNGIKTITLVHGILNPPFAYIPVISDYIFCWGDYQKEQLKSYKVPQQKIIVTGNPIAKSSKVVKRKVEPKGKIRIGIGLNPMPLLENIAFINYLLAINNSNNVDWIVKLHPAMYKDKFVNYLDVDNVKIFSSKEITNEAFFEKIDLLIVGNSGLGFEAVAHNVPIWVYRISEGKNGNDGVMIEDGNAPDISDQDIFIKEFAYLLAKNDYLVTLLQRQRYFLDSKFYFAVSNDAIINIIKELNKLLN